METGPACVRVALARKTVMCQVVVGCGMVRCDLKRRRMGWDGNGEGCDGWGMVRMDRTDAGRDAP